MNVTDQRKIDRQRIIEACGGRLTANDDHFIDRVTDVVTRARQEAAPAPLTVEQIVSEISGLSPGNYSLLIYERNHVPAVRVYAFGRDFHAPTLTEAMQQVRQAKEKSKCT